MPDAPLLEAKNISLARLWTGASFAVRAGELLHITGKNGAGKTSMLQVLCGLAAPDEGGVFWQNKNIQNCAEEYCADLAYVGHKDGIKNDCTPLENLQFAAAMQTSETAMSPAAALAKIGLLETQKLCRQLSAGQKRRAALARLLVGRARLWFLDEPLAALDESARRILGELAAAHLASGGAAVVATHDETGWQGAAKTLRLGQQ